MKLLPPKLSCLFAVCGLLILMSGCGYRFGVQGPGPTIGGGLSGPEGPPVLLAIRNFVNATFHPNLDIKYTKYVRREFKTSSGAKVLNEENAADYLMKGEIVSVSVPSVAFTPTNTRESRVQVVVRVTVEDQKTNKIVWNQTTTGIAEFFVGAASNTETETGLQFNQVLQERALEQAGIKIAVDLADDFGSAKTRGVFMKAPPSEKGSPAPSPPTS